MNVAGTVILYHPPLSVISNIKTYLPFIKVLYVFDNTETADELLHKQLKEMNSIVVIHDAENKGISVRLNTAAKMSLLENYDWLLTMDQDSSFEKNDLEKYISCVETVEVKEKVAMFGVNHEGNTHIINCKPKEVSQLITSGSIINLYLFDCLGGFDEALFIDEVDTEYCYNAITKGYKIVKFENIFLNHSLGILSYHTSLKNLKKISRTLHSPERMYYMVRNHFYINKKYSKKFIEEKKIRRLDLLNRIKNYLLYGKSKLNLLYNIAAGWKDYKRNNLGKKNINEFKGGFKK